MTSLNIAAADTATLLAFYNEHAERPLKAFRNRAQAEQKVAALIQEHTPEDSVDVTPTGPSLLSSLVGQVTAEPTPEPEPEDNTVSLAALCAELQVVPRIARRRLRKALGNLQEGRWEWDAEDDCLLAQIRSIIRGAPANTVTAATDEE